MEAIKERFARFLRETSSELNLPEIHIARVIVDLYLKGEIDTSTKPVLRGESGGKKEAISIWEYIRP